MDRERKEKFLELFMGGATVALAAEEAGLRLHEANHILRTRLFALLGELGSGPFELFSIPKPTPWPPDVPQVDF